MTVAERKRQVDRLAERCYAGLDVATLQHAVLQGLRRLMSIDAAFFATVDPATILFTSLHAEEPLNHVPLPRQRVRARRRQQVRDAGDSW
ncbi:MAG: hypothetical protein ACRD2W_07650 [Acidimicrobiales bacterium]